MTTRRSVLVVAWMAAAACGWTDTPQSAQPIPPAALGYGANPATYTKGVAIPPNAPHSSGGAVRSYAVAPALPTGLALDPASGVLSGVPGVVSPRARYVVTASNAYGEVTTALDLTINDAPPSGLAYGLNPATYTRGVAIEPNSPSSSGGVVTSYAVAPPLPAGLGLDTASGVVSGTPTAVAPQASYTVTATNVSGSASVALVIAVKEEPPAGLSYPGFPASVVRGVAMTRRNPTLASGTAQSYAVAPALPAGIGLNTATGAVDGTPTQLAAARTYTITASNGSGSTSADVAFSVVEGTPVASFQPSSVTWTVGTRVSATPSVTGGAVDSWAIVPATLPAGLSFNTGTGTVSGVPTTPTGGAVSYLVVPTNTLGAGTSATLAITVTP